MHLPNWLQQLTQRGRTVSRGDRRHRVQPRLEVLEDRLTPSADLVFTSAAQTLIVGQASILTVQLQDGSGHVMQAPSGGLTFSLSSSSPTGVFLDASGVPLSHAPSVFLPAGTSTARFEYEGTQTGTPTLTVTATGLSATQQETIIPSAGIIHVSNTNDSGDGSLRSAILAADAAPGSTPSAAPATAALPSSTVAARVLAPRRVSTRMKMSLLSWMSWHCLPSVPGRCGTVTVPGREI